MRNVNQDELILKQQEAIHTLHTEGHCLEHESGVRRAAPAPAGDGVPGGRGVPRQDPQAPALA